MKFLGCMCVCFFVWHRGQFFCDLDGAQKYFVLWGCRPWDSYFVSSVLRLSSLPQHAIMIESTWGFGTQTCSHYSHSTLSSVESNIHRYDLVLIISRSQVHFLNLNHRRHLLMKPESSLHVFAIPLRFLMSEISTPSHHGCTPHTHTLTARAPGSDPFSWPVFIIEPGNLLSLLQDLPLQFVGGERVLEQLHLQSAGLVHHLQASRQCGHTSYNMLMTIHWMGQPSMSQ